MARLVPVWREILCDDLTPVGAFARLRGLAPTRFLLESVVGGERWARFSFLGVGHRAHLRGRVEDGRLRVDVEPGPGFRLPPLPVGDEGLAVVRALRDAYAAEAAPELPRFWGGLVGVWGHDVVRCFERLPEPPHRPSSRLPAVELLATDALVAFDNLTQRVRIFATACPDTDGDDHLEKARARIDAIERSLRAPEPGPGLRTLPLRDDLEVSCDPAPPWSSARHVEAVARAKEHIAAGDAFQIVLAQAFEVPRAGLDPLDVYRVLRVTNPAPYMMLLELPSATLVGASPEVLVRVDRDRTVTVRPIAGTRPRGRDDAEDRALEAELRADPKERAEHLMLVDLGRNDIGRVAVAGSVRVGDTFVTERYSRVMHLVSEVSGKLRPELDALDALRATFPAGTLSGAPKVRALEIIDALEPMSRGWYGGAVGYLGYDGGADFAICIRSAVASTDTLRVVAGSGIVHDSDPAAEDAECRAKASAVLRAIAIAREDGR